MKILIIAVGILFTFLTVTVSAAEIDAGLSALKAGRYAAALKVLIPLANSGNDEAQRVVGEMCYNGQGMKRDFVASFKWNEIAAENGNKIAQYNLGYLYEKGEGVAASRAHAIDWYTKSAIQGYVAAQHKLGDIYASSDQSKAIYWYKSAGDSGDEVARKNFARLSSESVAASQEAEERQAQKRRDEEEDQARERLAERERRDAQEAENRQSSGDASAGIYADMQKNILGNMQQINSNLQPSVDAYAASNRARAAQDEERNRAARAALEVRQEQRRRDADRERAARDEAQRAARAKAVASSPDLPKYQPQVVIIPSSPKSCPPGSSPARQANGQYVTVPPTAYCVKDTQSGSGQGQGQNASNSNTGSSQNDGSGSASGSTAGQSTTSAGGLTGSTTSNTKKIEWGPIQWEAFAICRQSESSKKWWCDGPGQNLILFDSPSVESALGGVECPLSEATAAGEGTTKSGKRADVYRCGYGMRSWDRNIVKIYGLAAAPRPYMCPKDKGLHCTDSYNGQVKR